MRIWLLAVGRARAGPLQGLTADYLRRLPWPAALREVEEKRSLAVGERRRREGELLLAASPPGSVLVGLDERGEDLTSRGLADRIAGWRDAGQADLAFAIGGADGLDDAVRRRAALLIAFGRMTWPHMLCRLMLAEQLYRAGTLLTGHPYHRS